MRKKFLLLKLPGLWYFIITAQAATRWLSWLRHPSTKQCQWHLVPIAFMSQIWHMPVWGFPVVTYIMWFWDKKGAFWTAIGFEEEKLTFLQKIEEILSEKQLGENELLCMFRQNAQVPNLWILEQTRNEDFLWIQVLVLGHVIKAQHLAAGHHFSSSCKTVLLLSTKQKGGGFSFTLQLTKCSSCIIFLCRTSDSW